MKKEDFLAEVARIYFQANSYEELFPYLALGYCSDVIDAQLNAIRSMDKNDIWQKVDASSVSENENAIKKYVEEQEVELASKFMSLEVEESGKLDLWLWFNTMYILSDFAADKQNFLLKVVAFFEKYVECFCGEQYWTLVTLLINQNMYETVVELSNHIGIGYDLPANVIVQVYNAKFCQK